MAEGKRIAVIGSGITGLSAAWLLHRSGADVVLYEKEATCGGHTLTDTTSDFPVDLGFQVYNLTTYPHLVGFLETLGVETEPSDMSFALSIDDGKLEWGSHNLDTVFAQRKNAASPTFLRMVADVIRFGQQAPKVLDAAHEREYRTMSLGQYLDQQGYSQGFRDNYVLPMCAAIWSVPNKQVLEFPIQTLVRFWLNHHLLDLVQRPVWRVVKGRSRSYVEKVLAELPDVRTGTAVTAVDNMPDGRVRVSAGGSAEQYDEYESVVFATHSDITLKLLGEGATADEKKILGAIPYNENDVYLHTDTSLMPRLRKTWASWNFMGSSEPAADTSPVCVSYWCNLLQNLPPHAPDMFVTLNPPKPPAEDKVIRKLKLAHPVYSFEAVQAQQALPSIQGKRGLYFAGAWCGYGFHEDGIKAGVAAATALGATVPWTPRACNPKVPLADQFFMGLFDKFARATIKTGYLRIILPTGGELVYGDIDKTAAPGAAGEEWRGRPALRATLRLFDTAFFRKVVVKHDTGMGESYMDGDYEVDDFGGFLAVAVANANGIEGSRGLLGIFNWLGDRLLYLSHLRRPNTIHGSRKNIEEHYDAGNAMYKLFLDETMTYSSGVHHPGHSLHQAQLNKLDAIIAKADIRAGDHVLEIGCGWGSFAIRAASKTGCRVTGVTISKEQLAEATARVKAAGLQDRVNLVFCDYRDIPGAGTFDKVVSIEMIEAVGHEHLVPYFGVIGKMLKPGGKAVIQAISEPDERYEDYCATSDFIREHIFPGGHLPCMGAMVEAARGTGLSVHAVQDIGPDYAITLREWRQRWEERKAEVLALGYSERFWRKYRFYFVYCEAAFDGRYIHNFHVTWVKDREVAQGAGAQAAAAAGPVSGSLGPVKDNLPSDPITQVLLAIYFFLTGMIVNRHTLLWLLPIITVVCTALAQAAHKASMVLTKCYGTLSPDKQARWCANVVHLLYSAATALATLAYICHEPAALDLMSPPPPQRARTPAVIICASTGFYAFQLWTCIRLRVFSRSLVPVAKYTALLCLFGVAAFRDVQLAFLTVALVSEASSVVHIASKLQRMAGVPDSAPARQHLLLAEKVVLVALRLLPHLVITLVVAIAPRAFSSVLYYLLALAGMVTCNVVNYHKATRVLLAPPAAPAGAKVHAE